MSEILQGVLKMPLPESPSEIDVVTWCHIRSAMREGSREIERLRACLDHTRDEICEGPVDGVLWHSAVPACTTVDNITLALNDGWTYDGWMMAKEEQV